MMPSYLLAYDADCGPCTRFKHLVDFLDAYHKIAFLSLTDANERGLLNRIPESLRFESFHLISTNGDIQSGSDALLDLIGLFPLGRPVSKIIIFFPGGKQMIKFLYDTFSRLHNGSSCHPIGSMKPENNNKDACKICPSNLEQ
jgi:predicted DCC family thiol-disulfide oxidoreductase YuxK